MFQEWWYILLEIVSYIYKTVQLVYKTSSHRDPENIFTDSSNIRIQFKIDIDVICIHYLHTEYKTEHDQWYVKERDCSQFDGWKFRWDVWWVKIQMRCAGLKVSVAGAWKFISYLQAVKCKVCLCIKILISNFL